MATYLFRENIESLKATGIDFSNNLVVPECDEKIKEELHHREDHNHLLKIIITCMREDLIPGCSVVHLRDALNDASKFVVLVVLLHIIIRMKKYSLITFFNLLNFFF